MTFILSSFTFATENYLGLYSTKVNEKALKDKFCTNNQKGDEFCMEYTLTYPIIFESKNLALKNSIEMIVNEKIRKFKKLSAKNMVLSLLSDEPDLTWSWEDKTQIKLYATTRNSFTLAIVNYNYSGGAHANRTVEYENYMLDSGKNIDIKDLFIKGYEKRLHLIANKFYRESNNLSEQDSLTKIGWFGDHFILSDNFAITRKGLEFLYNPYEIKPHIAGITKFLLPYDRIASLIKNDK